MPLSAALSEYRLAINQVNDLIVAAHTMNPPGSYVWSAYQRTLITESSFLRAFIAWETFLESSFTLYMLGTSSAVGNTITRYVSPIDRQHAERILIGTMRYVDWANPDIVRRLAGLFFDGGAPFESVLSSVNSDLLDLKTIRNAAAHLSSTTSKQLDSLGSRKLGSPRANITVYDLILAADPGAVAGGTILETYLGVLDGAAEQIANA